MLIHCARFQAGDLRGNYCQVLCPRCEVTRLGKDASREFVPINRMAGSSPDRTALLVESMSLSNYGSTRAAVVEAKDSNLRSYHLYDDRESRLLQAFVVSIGPHNPLNRVL